MLPRGSSRDDIRKRQELLNNLVEGHAGGMVWRRYGACCGSGECPITVDGEEIERVHAAADGDIEELSRWIDEDARRVR
jgi:hypothetical protein